jgi:hypothetical protein
MVSCCRASSHASACPAHPTVTLTARVARPLSAASAPAGTELRALPFLVLQADCVGVDTALGTSEAPGAPTAGEAGKRGAESVGRARHQLHDALGKPIGGSSYPSAARR